MEFELLKNKFTKDQCRQLNPLVLAYVGDAVYEMFIRIYLVSENNDMSAHKLHVNAISYVKAQSQSNYILDLISNLNEEEQWIFKRGRNAKSATSPKNADIIDYRNATGFEALIGYLYLTEQLDRVNYIFREIIKLKNKKMNNEV